LFVGRATLDVVYSLHHFPSEDTKIFARATHVAPGGPATNAAITHSLLGGRGVLMAAVGGGPWAIPVREELRGLGIDLIDLAAGTAYETPLTTVLVNVAGATRTIVNPPLADIELRRPEVWDPAWGEPPGVVLTDGFHLSETLALLRACQRQGARVCLDAGSWKQGTEDLAGILSVAICGERFAIPQRASDPGSVIAWLAENGVPHIAITRGAKPILGCDRGQRFEIEIAAIQAVDTTGAGDVLHGAFCYQFAQTGDFEESLRLASEIATRACRGLGIRAWMERA
jgi:sugar/nucleoside kinase (ribokinase family)